MRRKIPSSSALLAFETAGRHGSFSRAAEELNLTEGAVSRQIGRLEDTLGVALFMRVKNRVHLTEDGRIYWEQVRADLERIEAHTLNLIARPSEGGVLELAVIPTFTNRWLIPRLLAFHALHPGITINISERPEPFLFADSEFDAALHYDHPAWTGMLKRRLFGEELVPICSPTLTNGLKFQDLSEINNHKLLHKRGRFDGWRNVFVHGGLKDGNPMQGNRYDLFSMIIEAARAGLGIGLVPRLYVLQEIARGELIIPFETSLPEEKHYCLVYPEHKHGSWPLNIFSEWLGRTAKIYAQDRESKTSSLQSNDGMV
jgi:LysR family transcriptional regulator, glycine cleavage system transcriptional activator